MIDIVEIAAPEDRKYAFKIRHAVFCDEQGVDPALEFDGYDEECRQYLARYNGRAAGTARIRDVEQGIVKVERVAVLAQHRGRGVGIALMDRTIADARAAGARKIAIHAQCHAEAFYAALGFRKSVEFLKKPTYPMSAWN